MLRPFLLHTTSPHRSPRKERNGKRNRRRPILHSQAIRPEVPVAPRNSRERVYIFNPAKADATRASGNPTTTHCGNATTFVQGRRQEGRCTHSYTVKKNITHSQGPRTRRCCPCLNLDERPLLKKKKKNVPAKTKHRAPSDTRAPAADTRREVAETHFPRWKDVYDALSVSCPSREAIESRQL